MIEPKQVLGFALRFDRAA